MAASSSAGSSLAASPPQFDAPAAARLARDRFGRSGAVSRLTSERDQNFLIDDPAGRVVLKIANAAESDAFLRAQHKALDLLASAGVPVPRLVPTRDGERLTHAIGPDGKQHAAWAVSWLPGQPLADQAYRSPELLHQLGQVAGSISHALVAFDDPAVHRDFYWDLANAPRIVAEYEGLLPDPELAAVIRALVERFDNGVAPVLPRLPKSVVHGDLNDHNILISSDAASARATGVLDLGDMVHTYAVADLAILCAYAALPSADWLHDAALVVRGFHSARPLGDDELTALFGLITMRLCASVCIAEHQRRLNPENAYLDVSQQAIRALLPRLAAIPLGLAEGVFRDTCGREPVVKGARVAEWLRARTSSFAPVLGMDLRTEPVLVLDLGVTSSFVTGDPTDINEPSLTKEVFDAMARVGVRVAVGRYDEPRLLYQSPLFAPGTRVTDERRTVHLGLDLFAPAGTPVFAPLDGTVEAFHDNAAHLDYGPVIILRHGTDDGASFFTLYGHLSRESLASLKAGQRVKRGERFASLGAAEVNGGWTPHLHLQIIVDDLGLGYDFPGVARPAERAVFRSLSPDPNLLVGIPESRFPRIETATGESLAKRRAHTGGNVALSYRRPVSAARGWMQYLFDDVGRRYIDAYNNVPHVGHCNPRVVEAGARQMRLLSTNTRYATSIFPEYVERLTSLFPESLSVCYLVNSASEANELALRLARAYTGGKDMVVLEGGYHGNTTSLIDISPYKHAGRGGSGAPDWVHVAKLPDDYRGPYKRADREAGSKYAADVARILDGLNRSKRRLAGFIAETAPSVGGQIILPPGYLAAVYKQIRQHGGVCIADEVQTGLGRLGAHCWAFEAQGVVPDIVALGKPLGNGHPIGAVVTTREIAQAFDNGMEFFSTFGGNTVSCAVGLAVLDALRDDGLQSHALDVGNELLAGLRELQQRHSLIGDVRGSGLFLGAELVRDRETLEAATAEASFVTNYMRDHGVLLGTEGPHENVLKIRPPMPFASHDATLLLEVLHDALGALST